MKKRNHAEEICQQGIDGCLFEISSVEHPNFTENIYLINSKGNNYGEIRIRGRKYVLFICLPHYLREDNRKPFGKKDLPYILNLYNDVNNKLIELFGRNYSSRLIEAEVNVTEEVEGNCKAENLFRLITNATLDKKEQNKLYINKSNDNALIPYTTGIKTRTIKGLWCVKCYDKGKNLGLELEKELVRLEFVLKARKINSIFGEQTSLENILSETGIMRLSLSYKEIFTEFIDSCLKPYLNHTVNFLFNELLESNSPTVTYARYKEIVGDQEQLRRALSKYYIAKGMKDNSRQTIYRLKNTIGLPVDTVKTIRRFIKSC